MSNTSRHTDVCEPCRRFDHDQCRGCTKCGCVMSAQYANRTQGGHRVLPVVALDFCQRCSGLRHGGLCRPRTPQR